MKFDPDWIIAIEGILFAIFASAAVGGIIISSTSLGFDEGVKKKKKEETIVLYSVWKTPKNVKPLTIISNFRRTKND